MTADQIRMIPLSEIEEDNIRSRMDPESLQGLVESLRAVGQLYPIRVRKTAKGYKVADGHRRVHALRGMGESGILAFVEPMEVSDLAALEQALISNIQREDLSPLDKARGIAQHMQTSGLKASEVAVRIGLKAPHVSKLLSYCRFSTELAERLDAHGIGPATVYELAKVEDPVTRVALAEELIAGKLTRDTLTARIKRSHVDKRAMQPASKSRFSAPLGHGQSVTVAWQGSGDLDDVIGLLEDILQRARKARAKGLSAKTLAKMIREEKGGAS
jgi:ParB family chromosome partitioning protein